jgi:hypothetical protein
MSTPIIAMNGISKTYGTDDSAVKAIKEAVREKQRSLR